MVPRPSPLHLVAWLLAFALTTVAVAMLFEGKLRSKMRDFEVYHTAAQRAASAQPLYRAEDGHYQYKYFPAFAVLFIPLGLLPLDTAKAMWAGLSIALLILLVRTSLALLPTRRLSALVLVVVTMLALAKFYGHELVLGQTNVLFALLLVGAVGGLLGGREAIGGVLAGLSVLVKPYAVVFLPYFLVVRRPVAALAMAGTVVGGLLLPVFLYGWRGNRSLLGQWLATVTGTTESTLTSQDNVSIFALAGKWMGDTVTAMWLAGALSIAFLIAALLIVRWRTRVAQPEYLEAAALLTSIPLLSPQGWDYVLLVSTPLVLCLVNAVPVLPSGWRVVLAASLAATGLSIYDLLGAARYKQFMALSLITVCYLALLAVTVEVRRRRIA